MSKEIIRTGLGVAATTYPNYLCQDFEEDGVYYRIYDMEKLVKEVSQIERKARIDELERLQKWDSFNEPYTWSGDDRPYKIVRNRIAELKGENDRT